jgi:hypothetical protein
MGEREQAKRCEQTRPEEQGADEGGGGDEQIAEQGGPAVGA